MEAESNANVGKELRALADSRVVKQCFQSMRDVIRSERVDTAMSCPSQLKCANIWLQASFGELMESVWADFPDQKIGYDKKIQNGQVLPFLNKYLQVSKRPRYQSFFIDANNFMADDAVDKAFRGLKINRFVCRAMRRENRKRYKGLYFRALKQTV